MENKNNAKKNRHWIIIFKQKRKEKKHANDLFRARKLENPMKNGNPLKQTSKMLTCVSIVLATSMSSIFN